MDIAGVMIIVYLVVVTAVGSFAARRSKSSKDWAVAGGGMGVVMVAMGLAGTRIGGVGTYGVAGDVVTEGVWNLWYGVSTFLALALVGLMFAIPYRRLELHTVGEIFWLRFRTSRCQRLTSLCVQTEYFIINIIEPYVIGNILAAVFGIPFWLGVVIGALVIIIYTTLGGLWGSAATNLIHCIVILSGLALIGFVGTDKLGGWDAIRTSVTETLEAKGIDAAAWWSFTGAGWGAIIGMIFSAVIHTPAASVYVNFSSAARNEKTLIPAFLLGGLIGSLMPFLAGWIGIQTVARYGEQAQARSYRTITEFAAELNPWIGGVALAAILAAVISSGGPILLSSATMFVKDWIPASRNAPAKVQLLGFRIATVAIGLAAAAVAVFAPIGSILDLLLFGFAVVCPPAIAVGFLIYWKRTTEAGAYWGILLGYGVGVVWYGLIKYAAYIEFTVTEDSSAMQQLFHTCFVGRGEGIDPSYPTTLIPLFAVPLISLITTDHEEQKEAFYEVLAGKQPASTLQQ